MFNELFGMRLLLRSHPQFGLRPHEGMPLTLPWLRPSLHRLPSSSSKTASAYITFYNAAARVRNSEQPRCSSSTATAPLPPAEDQQSEEPQFRIRTHSTEFGNAKRNLWPRMPKQENVLEVRQFRKEYNSVYREETRRDKEVTVRGMNMTTHSGY